ncbi:hypothetical protein M1N67_01415 [Peptococcaceae bacterium]|nr:hypothetical protein [Peptococcaceae bacterium]
MKYNKNIQGKPKETTTMRRADLAAEVTLESGEKVVAVVMQRVGKTKCRLKR